MISVQRLAIGKAPLGSSLVEDTAVPLWSANSQLVVGTSEPGLVGQISSFWGLIPYSTYSNKQFHGTFGSQLTSFYADLEYTDSYTLSITFHPDRFVDDESRDPEIPSVYLERAWHP